MVNTKKPAVFLDRDGTIIEDTHYPRDPEKVRFVYGASEALLSIQKKGYLLFVISNQSGVGRGIISEAQFQSVHNRFCELLKLKQIKVEEFAYCFHKPEDSCDCRKPATKLIRDLAKTYCVDLNKSYVVGDKWSDVLLAHRVGAQGVLFRGQDPGTKPQELDAYNFTDLRTWAEVNELILPLHSLRDF